MPYLKMETYKERKLRQVAAESGGELAEGTRHSGFYHSYFEGYSEESVEKLGEKGKKFTYKKITRKYVGEYFIRDCNDIVWIVLKIRYVLLYLAAAGLNIFALSCPVQCNTVWYTAAPGLISMLFMIILFSKLMSCIAAPRKMKAFDYKYCYKRLSIYSYITSGGIALTSLMMLLHIILQPEAVSANDLQAFVFCLISAGIVLVIGIVESNAKYRKLPNESTPYENGVIIQ